MVDSVKLLRGAWVVMGLLVILLLMEVGHWRRDMRYNEAVAASAYGRAAEVAAGEAAVWALAAATPDAQFDDKVALLSRLSRGNSAPDDARYNLANVYLRRALSLDPEEDQDILVPLVEQAKQHYRQLLEADPNHLDAKFNLELALVLLPEGEQVEADAEFNPERSERAISSIRVEEQLP